MILFESTDSVIEVLWDVALAFFIVRLAFVDYAGKLLQDVMSNSPLSCRFCDANS